MSDNATSPVESYIYITHQLTYQVVAILAQMIKNNIILQGNSDDQYDVLTDNFWN